MFDYTSNRHAVMGMLSKNYKTLDDYKGYQKNSKEVVLFDLSLLPIYLSVFPKINLSYLVEMPILDLSSNYIILSQRKEFMLVGEISDEFMALKGKRWIEIRETRNKYDKVISITNEIDQEKVIEFIRQWNELRGKSKYGWQLHSGYDINFFQTFYEQEKDNLWCHFFMLNDELVGYSVISRLAEGKDHCFDYVIRKTRTDLRNLCLYVDFKSFENIYRERKDFRINWGCSTGTLLKYKKKFPVFSLEPRYFVKLKDLDYGK